MKKGFLISLVLFFLFFIIGCSSLDTGNSKQEINESSQNSSSVLVVEKKVLSAQTRGKWMQSVYIDDKLYYVTQRNKDDLKVTEVNVYQENINEELLSEQSIMAPSIAFYKSDNICFVLVENMDDYKIVNVSNDGSWNYHDMSDISKGIIDREGILSGVITEKWYCIMTTLGTLLMWDNSWDEMKPVYPDWQKDILYDEANYEYGLINGNAGGYVYLKQNDDIQIQLIELYGGNLGKKIQISIPEEIENVNNAVLFSGFDKGVYILVDEYLLHYDDAKNVCSKIENLSELNMENSLEFIDSIREDETGKIYLAGYDHNNKEGIVFCVEEKDSDNVKNNTVILGYIYDPSKSTLDSCVEKFNLEHSEIDIEFKKYDNFLDLQMDIIRGNGPDILSLFRMDINEYVEKGILENLAPYFNESKNISKGDLLPAMQTLMTRDEGIRFVYPWFTLEILLLDDSIDLQNGITTTEFLKLSKEAEDEYLCGYSSSSLLYKLFPLEQNKYINWEERKCFFDSEDFILFLKNLKQADLPKKDPYIELTYAEQMEQGKYLALFSYMKCLQDYGEIKDAFGSTVNISGYPNWQGEDIYPINISAGCLGINSASERKDEAWKFLEYYLLDYAENINLQGGYFSVLTHTFSEQINPSNIKKNSKLFTNVYDNFYTGVEKIEVRTEYSTEEIEQIRHMVDNAVWSDPVLSGEIGKIIMEEVAYYLKGDKTPEEVAGIVQSRVSIYMEE